MNLIDFHVTRIISEETDKYWKLLGMTKEELDKELEDDNLEDWWKDKLLKDATKQVYEIVDMGGKEIKDEIFFEGQEKYYVGYKGLH